MIYCPACKKYFTGKWDLLAYLPCPECGWRRKA